MCLRMCACARVRVMYVLHARNFVLYSPRATPMFYTVLSYLRVLGTWRALERITDYFGKSRAHLEKSPSTFLS